MHPAAEIDQPLWALNQCSKHVRRKRVHSEDRCVAFRTRAAVALQIDASVVDDGAHASDSVHLVGDRTRLGAAIRSPMTTPAERGATSVSTAARSNERACRTTS